jgi:hypothetical protein
VEWLLNYARNANKPILVASAITTKKVNAKRRLTPMRLPNPLTHHQRTKSAHAPHVEQHDIVAQRGEPRNGAAAAILGIARMAARDDDFAFVDSRRHVRRILRHSIHRCRSSHDSGTSQHVSTIHWTSRHPV